MSGRKHPGAGHVVVVGNGMAGARFATELRHRAGQSGDAADTKVTVLGAEPEPAYNRILLSVVLAGGLAEPDIALVESAGRGVDVRTGAEVTGIDPDRRLVTVRDRHGAERVGYDRLVLATGGEPVVPPLAGLATAGSGDPADPAAPDPALPERVAVFRTLADCRRILTVADRARSALVLGGGPLGLEAARGLAGRGLATTLVHPAGHLMHRLLDPTAGAVLAGTLAGLGVGTRLDAPAVGLATGPDRVELTLADGDRLAADLLVIACGVRPRTRLARAAGLVVERGVVVDDRLRTSHPDIHAIGDCAQHRGSVGGLVAPAWEQARVLAAVLAGDRHTRYRPPPEVTRLKADGIDLAAMGSVDAGSEQLTFTDPARGTYARLAIESDRLAGAILLGDNPAVGQVIQLFDRGGPVPDDRRGLLLGRSAGTGGAGGADGSPALIPDAATICQCNGVRKRDLVDGWRAGAHTVDQLVTETRATTGCGTCREAVTGIVDWLNRTDTVEV